MFIVSLNYIGKLSEVDKYLEDHIDYLNRYYELGIFIASGRKVPRTGGVILAQAKDRTALEGILNDDPFIIYNLADYELTEFIPSKMVPELASLIN